MAVQNYKNHRMYYAPHHFIYLPLILACQVYGIYKAVTVVADKLPWILFSIIIFLIAYLTLMLRQHYALGLQNRIVRLEFKQRYFELYGRRSDPVEAQLNFGHIAALRFANDDEFKILLEKALQQNISGDDIKKSITAWRADNHRV